MSGPIVASKQVRAPSHGEATLVEQAINQGMERNSFRALDVADAVAYAHGNPGPEEELPDGPWTVWRIGVDVADALVADWPTEVRAIVVRHGGQLLGKLRAVRTRRLVLPVGWPTPGPAGREVDELRDELNAALVRR